MSQRRLDRVNVLIKQALAELLLFKSKDPRLKNITVTEVKVSPDLKKAYVKYSLIADEKEKKAVADALKSASGFFRFEIGQMLELKYTPEFSFSFDRNLEYAQSINEVFKKISTSTDEDKVD